MATKSSASRLHSSLSEKEASTLSLLIRGYKVSEIAKELKVSTQYIYYLQRLLRVRLDVDTNAGIALRAIAEGIVSEDGTILRK